MIPRASGARVADPKRSRIAPPNAYDIWPNEARGEWMDGLLAKIQKGLNPQAYQGPSRSPSPLDAAPERDILIDREKEALGDDGGEEDEAEFANEGYIGGEDGEYDEESEGGYDDEDEEDGDEENEEDEVGYGEEGELQADGVRHILPGIHAPQKQDELRPSGEVAQEEAEVHEHELEHAYDEGYEDGLEMGYQEGFGEGYDEEHEGGEPVEVEDAGLQGEEVRGEEADQLMAEIQAAVPLNLVDPITNYLQDSEPAYPEDAVASASAQPRAPVFQQPPSFSTLAAEATHSIYPPLPAPHIPASNAPASNVPLASPPLPAQAVYPSLPAAPVFDPTLLDPTLLAAAGDDITRQALEAVGFDMAGFVNDPASVQGGIEEDELADDDDDDDEAAGLSDDRMQEESHGDYAQEGASGQYRPVSDEDEEEEEELEEGYEEDENGYGQEDDQQEDEEEEDEEEEEDDEEDEEADGDMPYRQTRLPFPPREGTRGSSPTNDVIEILSSDEEDEEVDAAGDGDEEMGSAAESDVGRDDEPEEDEFEGGTDDDDEEEEEEQDEQAEDGDEEGAAAQVQAGEERSGLDYQEEAETIELEAFEVDAAPQNLTAPVPEPTLTPDVMEQRGSSESEMTPEPVSGAQWVMEEETAEVIVERGDFPAEHVDGMVEGERERVEPDALSTVFSAQEIEVPLATTNPTTVPQQPMVIDDDTEIMPQDAPTMGVEYVGAAEIREMVETPGEDVTSGKVEEVAIARTSPKAVLQHSIIVDDDEDTESHSDPTMGVEYVGADAIEDMVETPYEIETPGELERAFMPEYEDRPDTAEEDEIEEDAAVTFSAIQAAYDILAETGSVDEPFEMDPDSRGGQKATVPPVEFEQGDADMPLVTMEVSAEESVTETIVEATRSPVTRVEVLPDEVLPDSPISRTAIEVTTQGFDASDISEPVVDGSQSEAASLGGGLSEQPQEEGLGPSLSEPDRSTELPAERDAPVNGEADLPLETEEPSAPELPDPQAVPEDTTMPLPYLFRDPELRRATSPTASMIVEPPSKAPNPESITLHPAREDTPEELPDPQAAPPDTSAPAPLSPGDHRIRAASLSPSLIVEPPAVMHTEDVATVAPTRQDTPELLPDPTLPAPDTHRPTPLSPGEGLLDVTPTPSVIVEPPMRDPDPRSITAVPSRASSWDGNVASPSVLGPPTADGVAVEDVFTKLEGGAGGLTGDANDIGQEVEVATEADDEKAQSEADSTASMDRVLAESASMRLRHHHGIAASETPEPQAANHHQRGYGRGPSISTPLVTRSHCFYCKLRIADGEHWATILVPQCTLADSERLEEEGCENGGEATTEEESTAQRIFEGHPVIREGLAHKTHRIVGHAIFEEGHCYLLDASEGALGVDEIMELGEEARQTPRPKRKSPVKRIEGLEQGIEGSNTDPVITPKGARATKRTRMSTPEAGPSQLATPSGTGEKRKSRRLDRAASNTTDDSQPVTPGRRRSTVTPSEEPRGVRRSARKSGVRASDFAKEDDLEEEKEVMEENAEAPADPDSSTSVRRSTRVSVAAASQDPEPESSADPEIEVNVTSTATPRRGRHRATASVEAPQGPSPPKSAKRMGRRTRGRGATQGSGAHESLPLTVPAAVDIAAANSEPEQEAEHEAGTSQEQGRRSSRHRVKEDDMAYRPTETEEAEAAAEDHDDEIVLRVEEVRNETADRVTPRKGRQSRSPVKMGKAAYTSGEEAESAEPADAAGTPRKGKGKRVDPPTSTRKRKARQSTVREEEEAKGAEIEVAADEGGRETRSMKRRAVDVEGKPEGESGKKVTTGKKDKRKSWIGGMWPFGKS